MIEKKEKISLVAFALISFLIIFAIAIKVYSISAYPEIKSADEIISKIENNPTAQFYVDEVIQNKHGLKIRGWAIKKDEEFKVNKSRYLLVNRETNQALSLKTYSSPRSDVYKYINNKEEWMSRFINAGMVAAAKNREHKEQYELVVCFDNGSTVEYINTGRKVEY